MLKDLNLIDRNFKKDKKVALKESRNIQNKINKYFSKSRYIFLKIVSIGKRSLTFILVFLIFLLLSLLLSYLISLILIEKNNSDLFTISLSILGISFTCWTGIVVAIILSLRSNDEYFNQTSYRSFFEIQFLKLFDNAYLSIMSFIYLILSVIFLCLSKYIDSVLESCISIFTTIFLFIRFLKYTKLNKYERFGYFIEHSKFYHKLNSADVIFDYLTMLKMLDTKNDCINYNLLSILVSKRTSYLSLFIDEMKKSAERGESILVEQNIIEDYLDKLSSIFHTPIELFSIYIVLNEYLQFLEEFDETLGKSFNKSINNINHTIHVTYKRSLSFINDLNLPLDSLPLNPIHFDAKQLLCSEYKKMIFAQVLFSVSCEQVLVVYKRVLGKRGFKLPSNDSEELDKILKEIQKSRESNMNHLNKWADDSDEFVKNYISDMGKELVNKVVNTTKTIE